LNLAKSTAGNLEQTVLMNLPLDADGEVERLPGIASALARSIM